MHQRDLVLVEREWLRAAYRRRAGRLGYLVAARLPPHDPLGFGDPPRRALNRTADDARLGDRGAAHAKRSRDVHQREVPHIPVGNLLEVEFGEIEGELIGQGVILSLSLINNLEVNEQILYGRMINIEQSTLIG